MAVIVVGGHSRSVGKTSVVAGIIAALPELHWTAMKITQYGHGICSANGELCDCATDDHSWAVTEERDRSGESDTSRFLVSGAARSLWVRTRQGMLAEAMPRVRKELASAENAILESNSVMRFLRPDLYLTVLDAANADFKASREGISRPRRRHHSSRWRGTSRVDGRLVEAGSCETDLPHLPAAVCYARSESNLYGRGSDMQRQTGHRPTVVAKQGIDNGPAAMESVPAVVASRALDALLSLRSFARSPESPLGVRVHLLCK